MSQFEESVNKYYKTILEQDAPPPNVGGTPPSPPDASGGAPPPPDASSGVLPPPDANGGASETEGDMDNEAKRDADPSEYTRSILSLLVDKKEGVTPEMFDDFIDSISLAITKIKDKEGLKKFYVGFHRRLVDVLELREELKSAFKQLSGTLGDLVGSQTEPDAGGGGVGMAGNAGPGVK